MKGLFKISILLLLGACIQVSAQEAVYSWIETDDFQKLGQHLTQHDVNERNGDEGMTLLVHSILKGSKESTEWLIENGADVNLPVKGKSPLMHASSSGEVKKVKLLVKTGAEIEAVDNEGNTALMYAAMEGDIKILKYLVKRADANLFHKNEFWLTAYDLSVRNHQSDAAKCIRARMERFMPDMRDGPYILWRGKKKIQAFYIVNDGKTQITSREKSTFRADSDPYRINGFAGDTLEYSIRSRSDIPPDLLNKVEKLMVMGDIHGSYDSLIYFLMKNGVINESLQWTWGEGHLVFVGDIFDRGDQVTESLWLIYQLELQAREAGGGVHLILGNHEIMVLSGDIYYVSPKYILMCNKLNINYPHLFHKKTILGQWLRTKNTIIRINGHLFVHAGLSPGIMDLGLDIHKINETVRYFLNHPDRLVYQDISREKLLGPDGPFWYRGYHEGNLEYDHLAEADFEKILDYFDAEMIFIGHTNVKQITSIYNNRVFALDVPFYTYGFPIQGLLIEGESVFRLNSAGQKTLVR